MKNLNLNGLFLNNPFFGIDFFKDLIYNKNAVKRYLGCAAE